MSTRQSSKSKRNSKPSIIVNVGEWVLLGGTRASYPANWYRGIVLWACDNNLLIQRSDQHGGTWLETAFVSEVRAKGGFEELWAIKKAAREGIQVFQRAVADRESELGQARDALFNKLEELAANGLNVLPPDFEAIDADHARAQEAFRQADAEAEATP